jgi:hypothetical protein
MAVFGLGGAIRSGLGGCKKCAHEALLGRAELGEAQDSVWDALGGRYVRFAASRRGHKTQPFGPHRPR